MSDYIPVVLCCDSNYAPYAAVASYSLCKHTQHPLKLIWLMPSSDVPLAEPVLSRMGEMGMRPMVIPVDGEIFANWSQFEHISLTSYFRLLIPDLVQEEKVIYLDCDVLVLDDLAAIFAADMKGALIGGVLDDGGSSHHFEALSNNDTYINAGMMVMDLVGLRQNNFLQECIQIQQLYSARLKYMDQCIINFYADNKKHILNARWNVQVPPNWTSYKAFQSKFEQIKPAVIHYIAAFKPWHGWCNPPIADVWRKYADEAKIPGAAVKPVTQIDQAMELAKVLDLNESFQQASAIKSQIIQSLMAAK